MFEHLHDRMEYHDPRTRAHGRGHGHDRNDPRCAERAECSCAAQDGGMQFGPPRGWGGGHAHGRERGEFDFGRGGGRPERLLAQGDLRWLVLDLIAAQPRHGYEIIKAIEEMTGGHYTPSPGVIYPTLTYLEETALIASEAQESKKCYRLTDEGRVALESHAAEIQALRARLGEARERFGGAPAPELMRALDNLRGAIHVRLAKGELTPASLATITAALDRATGEIERS